MTDDFVSFVMHTTAQPTQQAEQQTSLTLHVPNVEFERLPFLLISQCNAEEDTVKRKDRYKFESIKD